MTKANLTPEQNEILNTIKESFISCNEKSKNETAFNFIDVSIFNETAKENQRQYAQRKSIYYAMKKALMENTKQKLRLLKIDLEKSEVLTIIFDDTNDDEFIFQVHNGSKGFKITSYITVDSDYIKNIGDVINYKNPREKYKLYTFEVINNKTKNAIGQVCSDTFEKLLNTSSFKKVIEDLS